jgi:hypothetical protein
MFGSTTDAVVFVGVGLVGPEVSTGQRGAAQLGRVGVVEAAVAGRPDVAAEGAPGQLVLRPVVVPSEGRRDLELAVAEGIVGEAQPGSDLLAPAEMDADLLDVGAETRDVLALRADAEIECQAARDLPAILYEHAPDVGPGLALGAEVVDRVVAVGPPALLPGGIADEGLVPENRDVAVVGVGQLHVVRGSPVADAGLEVVRAGGREDLGQLQIQELAGRDVVIVDRGSWEVAEPGRMLELGRNARESRGSS